MANKVVDNVSFINKETGEKINDPARELTVDPLRRDRMADKTGIYVRARDAEGLWDSFDIAQLDAPSLLAWLRSRGGENPWAETVVAMLLDHHVEVAD